MHPIFIIVPIVLLLILILVVILRLFFKDKAPEKGSLTLSNINREEGSSNPPTEEKLAELVKNHAVLLEQLDQRYIIGKKKFYLEANLMSNSLTLPRQIWFIQSNEFLESYYQVNLCRLGILEKKSETQVLTNDELAKAKNYRNDTVHGIWTLNHKVRHDLDPSDDLEIYLTLVLFQVCTIPDFSKFTEEHLKLMEKIKDEQVKKLLTEKLLETAEKMHKIRDIFVQIGCDTDRNIQEVQQIDEIIRYLENL